jgi:hypothetical protein
VGGLRTEFTFTLPKGYVDGEGNLHRQGTMRLATARDEIEPLRDPRVADANDPYLTVIVLSRVVTRLGAVTQVTPKVVEDLFAADLAFLQDVYGIVNFGDQADLAVLQAAVLGEDDDRDANDLGPAFDAEDETIELEDVGAGVDRAAGAPALAARTAPDAGPDGTLFPSVGRRSAIQEVRADR